MPQTTSLKHLTAIITVPPAVEIESIVSQSNEKTIETSHLMMPDQNDSKPDFDNSENDSATQILKEKTSATKKRIVQLESALDQCQVYIQELKQALSDQEFLESQLASTEEYSHIQQKAIAALRDQLHQKQSDETTLTILRQQRDGLSEQVEHQRQLIEELEEYCLKVEEKAQNSQSLVSKLEAELQFAQDADVEVTQQRIIAQQTNERLRGEVRILEEQVTILEDKLKKGEAGTKRYLAIINALQNAHKSDSTKNIAIKNLSDALLQSQEKIRHLEQESSNQALMLAQLQQASLELEDNTLEYIERVEAQDTQIHEMQEQILHQAQEGREYETAVQHWKDKTEKYESFLAQLIHLLDSFPSDPSNIDPEQYATLVELREKLF